MLEKISVPDIGDYANVEIIGIAVKSGDVVEKDAELITLETDKATMEIPAPMAGTIKELLVKVGDKVSMGSPILMLETAQASSQPNVAKVAEPTTNKSAQTATQDLFMPDIGSDKPAEIIELMLKPGMQLNKDDTILTLESEKASMDVPASLAGTVQEVLVKLGDKVKTGDKVATILVSGVGPTSTINKSQTQSSVVKSSSPAEQRTETTETKAAAAHATEPLNLPSQQDVYAGPGVRRYARELGVDLNKVSGSGRKSRIIENDVKDHVKKVMQGAVNTNNNSSGLNITPAPTIDFSQFGATETQALNRIQKISGTFLHRNWVTIPHVTQFDEADITDLEVFRKGQKEIAEKQGVKLTPIVFLMKGIVACLKQFPKFNSSLTSNGEELVLKKYYHVGVAVDTPNGLVVPVIRNVDQKGLFELAAELAAISKKAREGKLTAADMQGGCFTISSLGGIGGTAFTPIINAPEVAILGVSRAQNKLLYVEDAPGADKFLPRLVLPLSLSYDHRVIDGADAARFTTFLVNQLADIRRLLL